jgi:hypothetical protein
MKPTTPAAAMLFAIGLLFASPAHAAAISLDYHLSASGFGPFAPVDPVTFTFHLAVDDAVAVTDQTDGLTVTDSNLALPSTMAFRYTPAGGFAIYGLQAGANLSQETDDFLAKFFFDTDFSIWRLHEFLYVTADTPHGWLFHTWSGSITPVSETGGPASEVPEPVGLVAVGVALTGLRGLLRKAR